MNRSLSIFVFIFGSLLSMSHKAEAKSPRKKPKAVITSQPKCPLSPLWLLKTKATLVLPNLKNKLQSHYLNWETENREILDHYDFTEIFWRSSYADGAFHIRMTSEQLTLFSSNNNPNPNYVWKVIPIAGKYQRLKSYLAKQNSPFLRGPGLVEFMPPLKEWSSEKEGDLLTKQWHFALTANFHFLIQLLNGALEPKDHIVPPVETADLKPRIQIGCEPPPRLHPRPEASGPG